MDKPNARELLKEALDRLSEVAMLYQNKGDIDLVKRIDAYLAAPSESAMEMARAIEAAIKPQYIESPNGRGGVMVVSKDYTDAAALIEGLQRRVPRKMLDGIIQYTKGMVEWNGEVSNYEFVDKIAAKHSVVIEE